MVATPGVRPRELKKVVPRQVLMLRRLPRRHQAPTGRVGSALRGGSGSDTVCGACARVGSGQDVATPGNVPFALGVSCLVHTQRRVRGWRTPHARATEKHGVTNEPSRPLGRTARERRDTPPRH